MLHKTKVIFITALIFLAGAGVVFGWVLYEVRGLGQQLLAQVQVIANKNVKEKKYVELTKLVEATAAERAALARHVLSEADTVAFLAEIEAVGKRQGVDLSTISLAVEEMKDGPDILTAQFKIAGPEATVIRMLSIFETLPYESTLTRVNLSRAKLTNLDLTMQLALY